MLKNIETETKWPPLRRWHFRMHFQSKVYHFDPNFTEVCSITVTSAEIHDVSDHRHFDCLLNSLFTLTPKKHPSSTLLVLYKGNPSIMLRVGPVYSKSILFHVISWLRMISFTDIYIYIYIYICVTQSKWFRENFIYLNTFTFWTVSPT